ncbi:MAG TPA: hypothetical protein VFD08_05940 [Clostridia bacterium]|nr:hypothetical protein [Clostridia bacterium]
MRVLLLIFLLLMSSCSQEKPEEMCLGVVEDYYESLITQDLQRQLEILAPFSLDAKSYNEGFLSHVLGGEVHEITIEHEDELLIMVKLDFTLILDESFKENVSFQPGENHVQRYFSFFKNDDYRLKEILNKAIY